MPATLSYPGVYVNEISSGVRTITGVSTSVTAFAGKAKRGPINKAIQILNYSDFEREFGGLDSDSFMSYAVRQYFMNGGGEAWVVRIVKDAVAATKLLQNNSAADVLLITAADEGKTGNSIEITVDYETDNPASSFNLHLDFVDKDNPSIKLSESFSNLSMNSKDYRYVKDIVNAGSSLVKVEESSALPAVIDPGTSISGTLTDVGLLVDDTHNQLRISVNGLEPVVEIQFNLPANVAGPDEAARLATLCSAIETKVQAAANGEAALSGFTCAPNSSNDKIEMTSGEAGETSSIRVLAGFRNDAAARLKLSTVNGGVETDAVAAIRPKEYPDHGVLASGFVVTTNLSNSPAIPSTGNSSFMISIDGMGPDPVDIGSDAPVGPTVDDKYQNIADRIQQKVRDLKKTKPAYAKFTCKVVGTGSNRKLVLTSGSRGNGSSVLVFEVTGDVLAARLELLAGIDDALATPAMNVTLGGGNESDFADAEAYNLYIASRDDRKGLYALENIDIFNLLCLPGISDGGILMDAESYCRERLAFLIADAPQDKTSPSDMGKVIIGATFPKSEYGAVYYPWVKIADPLQNGKLKSVPPSGTIAGLYARTDATRGVWKAPAGTNAFLTGVQGVEHLLTDPENGTLNPLGVNCIRIFPVYGAVAWGARTLRGADQMSSEYKYIPVRRLALYLEESLYRALKWVVFEPNDEPLWSQVRLNVGAFMHNLFRQGAFQGQTPKDAYLVKCDSETTTQNDINLGVVNILVGFAPLKPAEFVMIKIQQLAGQIEI